jgi:hypothetical protein
MSVPFTSYACYSILHPPIPSRTHCSNPFTHTSCALPYISNVLHHHHYSWTRPHPRPVCDYPGAPGLAVPCCMFLFWFPTVYQHPCTCPCMCVLGVWLFVMQMVAVRREAADAMDDFRRMFASEKQPLLDTIASLRLGAARAEEERERVTAAHDAERR